MSRARTLTPLTPDPTQFVNLTQFIFFGGLFVSLLFVYIYLFTISAPFMSVAENRELAGISFVIEVCEPSIKEYFTRCYSAGD